MKHYFITWDTTDSKGNPRGTIHYIAYNKEALKEGLDYYNLRPYEPKHCYTANLHERTSELADLITIGEKYIAPDGKVWYIHKRKDLKLPAWHA